MPEKDDVVEEVVEDKIDDKTEEEKVDSEDSGEQSSLEVSDEDFMKLEEPEEEVAEDKSDEVDAAAAAKKEEKVEDKTDDKDPDEKEDDVDPDDKKEEEKEDKVEDKKEEEVVDDKTKVKDEKVDDKVDDKVKDDKASKATGTIDYEVEYKKLLTPFKANGVDITVKSVEDAVTLMQMGANYHKKMAGLKPSLKVLKLLENNDLMDQEKLNFLIDLKNKNPEAITKLLKDSKIDPLNLDLTKDSTYTPTARTVSDGEVELDQALESIQDSPHYAQTLNIVSKQWDQKSRNDIANSPQIIPLINAQIADGTYKTVSEAMEYERSLGRLQGLSDFEAYKEVGDVLYKAGKLGPTPTTETATTETAVKKTDTAVKKATLTEEERKKKKKAASSTTQVASTGTDPDFNPLALSDEAFEKLKIDGLTDQ